METVINLQLEAGVAKNVVKLPLNIERAQTENLYIALQTLHIHVQPTPPTIGKIRLLELDSFNNNLVQDKILDVFKIEQLNIHKERKVLDYVKLSHHNLASLSIEILGSNDKPVLLSKPGYLSLRLKAMTKEYSSFSIHVTEEGKRKISGFRYELPYPIHLEQKGTWKLALSSVVFPNPNVGKDTELRITCILGNVNVSWTYEESKIWNIRKFINTLQLDIRAKLKLKRNQQFRLGIMESKNFALISSEPITVILSNRFAYLLGFVDDGFTKAGRSIDLVPNRKMVFPNTVDLGRDVTEAVYLKCSQIAPCIVNDKFDHVLKLLPIKSKSAKYFYYETEEPEYHIILPSTLSHLNFQLLDQNFLPLPYKSTRFDKIFISLKIIHEI